MKQTGGQGGHGCNFVVDASFRPFARDAQTHEMVRARGCIDGVTCELLCERRWRQSVDLARPCHGLGMNGGVRFNGRRLARAS